MLCYFVSYFILFLCFALHERSIDRCNSSDLTVVVRWVVVIAVFWRPRIFLVSASSLSLTSVVVVVIIIVVFIVVVVMRLLMVHMIVTKWKVWLVVVTKRWRRWRSRRDKSRRLEASPSDDAQARRRKNGFSDFDCLSFCSSCISASVELPKGRKHFQVNVRAVFQSGNNLAHLFLVYFDLLSALLRKSCTHVFSHFRSQTIASWRFVITGVSMAI